MAQGRPALALTGRRPAPPRPTPEDLRAESDPDLVGVIRERIESAGGRITFAEFMELALYHPEHGYYLGATVRSAREGDFLTAPELHPIFGRVVGRQLAELWDILGRPPRFTMREYGAGPGTLGLAVLEGLRTDESELLAAVVYEPIELNPGHRRMLADRFAAAGLADRFEWAAEVDRSDHADAQTPGPPGGAGMVGVVFANEFVDALPVHRVAGTGRGTLRELFVTWRDGWFAEQSGDPSTPELGAYFARLGIRLARDQRAEVNLAMAGWLNEVAANLERGYVLLIDYGHPAAELFSAARAGGTLRAYRAHTAHADPFRYVGRQDLTAHVDFTTLARWAEERDLTPLAMTTQARFLVAGGLEGLFTAERERPGLGTESYLGLRASVGRFLDPRALGTFRVLLLGRDIPTDRWSSGFREAEMPS